MHFIRKRISKAPLIDFEMCPYIGQVKLLVLKRGLDQTRGHAQQQAGLDKVRGQRHKVLMVLVYEL